METNFGAEASDGAKVYAEVDEMKNMRDASVTPPRYAA